MPLPIKENFTMSTKFEQLLDYLVNEEMDKANELFHEIVVEKSRSIYENLIAEEDDEEMDEAAEDEEMDEAREEDDEEMDESMEDEEMDESEEDLEDSYMMDGETGDETDDLGGEISADGDNFDAPSDDDMGGEGDEDSAMMDIKNAIEELEAAFAELEQAQGSENGDMDMDSEFGDEEDGEDDEMEMMGMGNMPMENRRITREYREKVGNDWDKNSQKTQGQALGANTGESFPSPTEGKSPISSGSGKPTTGANAKNLNQGSVEGQSNTGTRPNKVTKGINPESGEQYTKGVEKNISGSSTAKMMDGAKLNKQGSGYPGNNKAPKPVGSGTGELAGQTSISSDKPFLKKL